MANAGALDDAVSAGKVLYVGISDSPAWVVARANTMAEWRGWSPLVAIQVPCSLIQRDVERELLPVASSLGLSAAAWGPLAGGVLSGKYTRVRSRPTPATTPTASPTATGRSPWPSTGWSTTSAPHRPRSRSPGPGDLGFPHDFINETAGVVYGDAGALVEDR